MGKYLKYKDEDEALKERNSSVLKNQRAWLSAKEAGDEAGMAAAHEAQKQNMADWDEYTGGTSGYDSEKGTWSMSDGARTESDGVRGNSYLSGHYDRNEAKGAKDYERAYNAYKNMSFDYSPENDPDYEAYKREYSKNGRFAMEDTVARMAARTGGVASSYAVSAGANAYNDYMARLSEKIPYLREIAYERYKDEEEKYLKLAELAKDEMKSDEESYEKSRKSYLEKKDEDAYLSSALIGAQMNGLSSLSDAERKLLYKSGYYLSPDTDEIVKNTGERYAAKAEDDGGKAAVALLKYRYKGTGFSSLTNDDIAALRDAGYTVGESFIMSPGGEKITPYIKSAKTAGSTASSSSRTAKSSAKAETKDDEGEKETLTIEGTTFTKRKFNKGNTVRKS